MTGYTVSPGTLATNITLNSGDTLTVLSGGSATNIADSGGTIYLSGGAAYAATLTNNAMLELFGGLASGTILRDFGYEMVYSGLSLDAVVSSGSQDTIETAGTASGTQISLGGLQNVDAGSSVSAVVNSGGTQYVDGSGMASATQVLSGGTQDLTFSGAAAYTQLGNGGVLLDGGTATGLVVSSGGIAVISGSGAALNTDVLAGGALVVQPGATVSGTSGGGLVVSTGVIYATLSGGLVVNPAGPITVSSGAMNYVLPDGVASLTTVGLVGEQLVLGGVTSGIVVSGGEQLVSGGTEYSTVLSAYGQQFMLGGVASDTQVLAGGYLAAGGGNVIAPVVSSGGNLEIYGGGSVSGAVLLSGGVGQNFGGFASATVLSAGATLSVDASGATSNTQILGGGTEVVAGDASGSVIYSGGLQLVSGGFSFQTEVLNGGTQQISAGIAFNTVISGGTVFLEDTGVISGGVTFAGAGGVLEIGANLYSLAAPISGFAPGDALSFTTLNDDPGVTSATLSGGFLTLTTSAGVTYDLPFAGVAGETFNTAAGNAGGLLVTANPLCFVAGTRIATPKGPRGVQDLKIGDLVETLHGGIQPVKWIGRRHISAQTLAGHPEMRPVLIKAGALDDGVPTHDLFVSPGHGICIDGGLVAAGRMINGVTIERDDEAFDVEYIHIELEEHEVLIAEGCGAESFMDDGFRDRFENAAEYDRLYPEPLPFPPVPCLETLEEGFVLDAILLRLGERAGIAPVEPLHGPLRGFVDQAGPELAAGWAQDESQPELPVCLDILEDGIRILRTLANRYREDLRLAGIGSGNHAFSVALPEGTSGVIEIRRTFDQLPLPLTDEARAMKE